MKKITFLCLGLLAALAMQAQIIHVPGDFQTIQQGINAANPGDTVIVSEGTYYEQINFSGKKPLVVASEFLLDGNADHISNTIIDGSEIASADSASVVYFISNEDSTSVLCGFTVQGGKGTVTEPWGFKFTCAGGIFIHYSGASILNNIIRENEVNDTIFPDFLGTIGGGLYAYNGWPGWVIIKNNKITNNRAYASRHAAQGGGFCIYNVNARIIGNAILNNLAQGTVTEAASSGGGCAILQDDNTPFWVFTDNEISDNQALAPDISMGSWGGGVALAGPNLTSYFMNNVLSGNKSSLAGGGLDLWSNAPTERNIENNYFINNEAMYGGGCDAFDSLSRMTLKNNVFIHNTAYDQGGAVYVNRMGGSPEEHLLISINNSFSDNKANGAGGAVYAYEDNPLIFNSIMYKNPGLDNNEITVESGTAEFAYSDVDTNKISGEKIIGAGMIYEDPLFSDLSLLLTEHWSPCVEEGAAEYNCVHGMLFASPESDILGSPRPVGSGHDMGAYDMEGWGLGIGQNTVSGLSISNWPNPVCTSTTFSYTMRKPGIVTIQIFDSFGQNVAIPVNCYQQKGKQLVDWNPGDLPAGMYFYRIQAGELTGCGKMILIK